MLNCVWNLVSFRSGFVWFRFAAVSFHNGFVWFRFAAVSFGFVSQSTVSPCIRPSASFVSFVITLRFPPRLARVRTSFSVILRQFRGHCPTLGAILSNKKFSQATELIIVNAFIRSLVFTTNFIRKAHWIIVLKVSRSTVNHKMSFWTLYKQNINKKPLWANKFHDKQLIEIASTPYCLITSCFNNNCSEIHNFTALMFLKLSSQFISNRTKMI